MLSTHPRHARDADSALDDDMLRLIFTCCHRPLPLRCKGRADASHGVRAARPRRSRALLASEDAMAQRLLRAKQKSVSPAFLEVPERDALEPRLRGVLAIDPLVFTEAMWRHRARDHDAADLARGSHPAGAAARR
jgi:RNA polymerase sigma-70 factor (ECF subfamily)